MKTPSSIYQNINQINPLAVQAYLKKSNWLEVESKRQSVGIFQKFFENDFAEIILPKDKDLLDYKRAMLRVAETIAVSENRKVDSVITDLLFPYSDTIHFKWGQEEVEKELISLDEAIDIMQQIRELLTILAQEEAILEQLSPTDSSKKAADFIQKCCLGKIDTAGFAIEIVTPLQKELQNFSRKVVLRLLTSIQLIQKNRTQQYLSSSSNLGVSDDFVNVLKAMLLRGNFSAWTISISWGTSLPMPEIRSQIRLSKKSIFEIETKN